MRFSEFQASRGPAAAAKEALAAKIFVWESKQPKNDSEKSNNKFRIRIPRF